MGAIAAIYHGKGIRGCLNYAFGVGKGIGGSTPRIIDQHFVGGDNPRLLAAEFREFRELAGPGKDVLDIAFSWRNEECPTPEVRAAYIADWFIEMGLGDQAPGQQEQDQKWESLH